MNGKTVEVDNTDAEGRLILSGEFSTSPLVMAERALYRCSDVCLARVQTAYPNRCRYAHGVRIPLPVT